MNTTGQVQRNLFATSEYAYGKQAEKQPNMEVRKIQKRLEVQKPDYQSYADSIRTQREKSKDTSLNLQKLKYQFKDISSKILRSKTSTSARQVASQAKREIMRLKRAKQSGKYDKEEIDAAIAHAKEMERVAKKKARHLEQEEMIERGKNGPVDVPAAKENSERTEEELSEEELAEEELAGEELSDRELSGEDFTEEMQLEAQEIAKEVQLQTQALLQAYTESLTEDFTEEFLDEMSEEMQELLEDMGLEDLLGESAGAVKEMDPEDLKMLKIKHRNKEMKDIVEADANYLKVIFDKLSKGTGSAGSMPSSSPSGASAVGAAPINVGAVGAGAISAPAIDICL